MIKFIYYVICISFFATVQAQSNIHSHVDRVFLFNPPHHCTLLSTGQVVCFKRNDLHPHRF